MDSYKTGNRREVELLTAKGVECLGVVRGFWTYPFDAAMQALGIDDADLVVRKGVPTVLVEDIKQAWELARRGGDYLGKTPGGAYLFRAME